MSGSWAQGWAAAVGGSSGHRGGWQRWEQEWGQRWATAGYFCCPPTFYKMWLSQVRVTCRTKLQELQTPGGGPQTCHTSTSPTADARGSQNHGLASHSQENCHLGHSLVYGVQTVMTPSTLCVRVYLLMARHLILESTWGRCRTLAIIEKSK